MRYVLFFAGGVFAALCGAALAADVKTIKVRPADPPALTKELLDPNPASMPLPGTVVVVVTTSPTSNAVVPVEMFSSSPMGMEMNSLGKMARK